MKRPAVYIPVGLLVLILITAFILTRKSVLVPLAMKAEKRNHPESDVDEAAFQTFQTSTLLGIAFNF